MNALHSSLRMAFKFSLRRWRIEMTLLLGLYGYSGSINYPKPLPSSASWRKGIAHAPLFKKLQQLR